MSLDTPRQGLVRDPRLYLIGWISNDTNEQPYYVPDGYMNKEHQNTLSRSLLIHIGSHAGKSFHGFICIIAVAGTCKRKTARL